MTKRLRALLDKRAKLIEQAEGITAEDDEDLTDEQREELDTVLASIQTTNGDIEREQARMEVMRQAEPEVDPDDSPTIEGGEPQILKDPKRGFAHFGEYATAVYRASNRSAQVVDERLQIMAAVPGSSYANEAAGADGGFTVPPEFASTVKEYSLEGDALTPFTSNDMVSGNTMKIPVDETTPWGTNGIRAYWEAEAALSTNTKPVLEQREWRLRKLFGLVPVSDELLEDSAFMASYLPRKLGVSIRYKVNDSIVNGNGANIPQGFINSGAIVEQAKETSQTADTIVAANVAKMYARNISPTTAIWLINPDAFPQIPLMTIGDQPIWTPPTEGMKRAPNGLLLGRPLLMSEHCQTVGDAGDIYFTALDWYQTISKARGIDFATSMHLWFDYDMTAFRAVFRFDGASLVRAAITPPNSSVTRSPFVRLAARA